MEYHLAGEESLHHLLDILRDLQFQIEFVHRDGKKMDSSALAEDYNSVNRVLFEKRRSG
jgi:hypothetical protein